MQPVKNPSRCGVVCVCEGMFGREWARVDKVVVQKDQHPVMAHGLPYNFVQPSLLPSKVSHHRPNHTTSGWYLTCKAASDIPEIDITRKQP